MFISSSVLGLTLFAAASQAAPQSFPTKPAASIQGFPAYAPADKIPDLQPTLHIGQGCRDFPVVDAEGFVSAGAALTPKGEPHAETVGCESSGKGQTYVRAGTGAGGKVNVVMYAWFFPKKQDSSGAGHPYAWASVVLTVDAADSTGSLLTAALSDDDYHHYYSYSSVTGGGTNAVALQNQHIHVTKGYASLSLSVPGTGGYSSPLIRWENMTPAARHALNVFPFGTLPSERCPFNDNNFATYVEWALVAHGKA